MIEAIRNAFKVPDLRKKMFFTVIIIAIYRLGTQVPVPGIDVGALEKLFADAAAQGGVLNFLDLFSGGALSNFALFALGIMPYITSSIIMQLLSAVVPTFERWSKEGDVGQKKITQVTRYMTLGIAIIEAIGYISLFQSQLPTVNFTLLDRYLIVLTLTAGTAVVMWLGELITQRGIGNGMSLLIFASIISRAPVSVGQTAGALGASYLVALLVLVLIILIAIVVMEKGQRRVPVNYAKRVVGRKVYGGSASYIPLKINSAGVVPIIFAVSVLMFPIFLANLLPKGPAGVLSNLLAQGSPLRLSLLFLLIVAFTYFYTAIVFNPIDWADNIKKYGGFIPGVRPGRPTAIHLNTILNRISLPGSFFLGLVAVVPEIFGSRLGIPFFANFGGTSLLIMVGVALETMSQLEAQLLQRHYEGFLK